MREELRQTLRQDAAEGLHWATVVYLSALCLMVPLLSMFAATIGLRVQQTYYGLTLGAGLLSGAHFCLTRQKLLDARLAVAGAIWLGTTVLGLLFLRQYVNGAASAALLFLVQCLFVQHEIQQGRLPRPLLVLLTSIFALQYLTCFTSQFPEASFGDYISGGAALHFTVLLLALKVLRREAFSSILCRTFSGMGGLWIVGAVLIGILFLVGSDEVRTELQNRRFVRDFVAFRQDHHFRLQFPFTHHNTLGLYALLIGFASLATARLETRRSLRILWKSVFALSLAALILTTTRGAWAAAAVGIVVYYVGSPGVRAGIKTILIAAAVALISILVFPQVQSRLRSTVDEQTYKAQTSTWVLRTHAFEAAWDMGARHPLLGVGYGPSAFQQVYQRDYLSSFPRDRELKLHAHNDLLEYFAESGALAASLFIGWIVLLLSFLWERRLLSPCAPAALGLLAAIVVFGLTNVAFVFPHAVLCWLAVALFMVGAGLKHSEAA